MDPDLEEFDAELEPPWSSPGPRVRRAAGWLCGYLDAWPAIGRDEDGRWGYVREGARGCRMQLWRLWSDVPVICLR